VTRPLRLEVGFVAHAHGLRGELELRTHDPQSQVLTQVSRVWLQRADETGHERRLAECRPTARGWLAKLEGVEGREAAEALRGTAVFVFRADLPPPRESDEEYFQGDLVGLHAVDEQGRPLGTIEALASHGPVPNLVVRTREGAELLIPFAADFVLRVEPDDGRIVLRFPEYEE
jgi:16S rRNA processing protein RimM